MEDFKQWASDVPTTVASFYKDISSMDLDLQERMSQAAFHTYHSVRLWFFLIVDLLRFLGSQISQFATWLFHLVRPWVTKGVVTFQELDLFTQLSIGAALVLVLLLWLTKRWIAQRRFVPRLYRWYRRKRQATGERLLAMQARVGEHSRVLAAMLPHLVMFGISAALIYLVPHYLDQIVNAWPLYALGVVWPIISCTRAIIHDDHWKMGLWLEYSIVAYFAIFISMLPFTQTAISFTPLFAEVRFFFILWLLLPVTRGSHLTFRKVLWALQRLSIPGFHDLPVPPSPVPAQGRARARRPRARNAGGDAAAEGFMGRVNYVLNTIMSYGQRVGQVGPLLVETLVMQGILTREFANRVLALRRDNIYQLVIFIGSFLAPVSLVGYLGLGILFPMRQSILMLAEEEMPRVKFWLQYWTMLAILSPVYSHFMPYLWLVPFKGTLTLIGILVLQFTDFPLEPMHEVFATIITIFEGIFRPQRAVAAPAAAAARNSARRRRHENSGGAGGEGEGSGASVPALPPPGAVDEFSLGKALVNGKGPRSAKNTPKSLRRRRRHKKKSDHAEEKDGAVSHASNVVEDSPAAQLQPQVEGEVLQQSGVADAKQDVLQPQPGERDSQSEGEGRPPESESCEYERRHVQHHAKSPKSDVDDKDGGDEAKHSGDENPEELGSNNSDSDYQYPVVAGDGADSGREGEAAAAAGKSEVVESSDSSPVVVRRSKRIRQKGRNKRGKGK